MSVIHRDWETSILVPSVGTNDVIHLSVRDLIGPHSGFRDEKNSSLSERTKRWYCLLLPPFTSQINPFLLSHETRFKNPPFPSPVEHIHIENKRSNEEAISNNSSPTSPPPSRINVLVEAKLLLFAFATGMQDATTFPDYHCFAPNQMGNTVLLAVGAAGTAGTLSSLPNVGVSFGVLIAGALIMSQIGNAVGGRRRPWLLVSNAVQTALVFAAAAWQCRGGSVVEAEGATAMGGIALLAFSSGAQVAMARSFKVAEITVVMAAAAWVDLLVEERLLVGRSRGRSQKASFLLSLLAGSFAGAFVYQRVGSAFALVISAVRKGAAFVPFCSTEEAASEGTDGRESRC